MIGGIRQALSSALTSEQRPDPAKLTNAIGTFIAGALRLTTRSQIRPGGRNKVA